MCMVTRDLNLSIRQDHYRIPVGKEITHELCGSTYFTKLDCMSYLFIVLDYNSSLQTPFNAPWGQYQVVCLPQSLACTQGIFQHMIDQILDCSESMIGITDDVIVHSKDDKNITDASTTSWNCLVNVSMCSTMESAVKQQSVTFFCCVYYKNGAHNDPTKVSRVQSMPPPRDTNSKCSSALSHTYHHLCLHVHPSLHLSVNCSRRTWSSNGMNHTRKPLSLSNAWSAQTLPMVL